ncbi:hypothetical protein EVAR_84891_1 [Eumeta japonica]|uniref:Uncharacterized protein n=1 Tax=Eumeta variegata TaxID=151549 RepID=A0A4C1YJF3_EUMVA|nr:hypothetical protein EVAR_84891_1 [Eumeta japonica]
MCHKFPLLRFIPLHSANESSGGPFPFIITLPPSPRPPLHSISSLEAANTSETSQGLQVFMGSVDHPLSDGSHARLSLKMPLKDFFLKKKHESQMTKCLSSFLFNEQK